MTRKSRRGEEHLSTPSMEEVIELLHDSPLGGGLTNLAGISSKLDEALEDLKRVMDMILNGDKIRVESTSIESEEVERADGGGDSAASELTDQVRRQMVDTATDLISTTNPVLGETIKKVYEADEEQWKHLGQTVRDIIFNINIHQIKDTVKDIKHEISGLFGIDYRTKVTETMTRKTMRMVKDIEQKLGDLDDTLKEALNAVDSSLSDGFSRLEELAIVLQESVVSSTDDIKRLLTEYHNSNMTWFNTLYQKLEECCVKDEVSALIEKSDAIQGQLDEVRRRLDGQPSPRDQSIEGETRSALKAIQAQLAEIRGLL